MAKANSIGYCHIMKRLPLGFRTIPEKNIHVCNGLVSTNRRRIAEGESKVYIFLDFESKKFNMKIGLEFAQVNFCPYCGAKL